MITPQQWKEIQIGWFFKRLFRFRCDGYALTLEFSIMKGGKIAYYIYVDGVLKSAWLNNDCEERRRFCCKKVKPLHSAREQKTWRQFARLNHRKYSNPEFVYYEPYWRSFAAFKKHLLANNTHIEYLEESYEKHHEQAA